ncbi:hypothetical protein NDU88_002730 [Pleurodeles waltl]|uniref:Uncharacterized protein n=1 Tax=Pleurodeles waltl TaxID=8319 RepID=A0AAV7UA22_PLEWA|nr:hypothetical protein NDU88_002730 [Pleurodeles waltl]
MLQWGPPATPPVLMLPLVSHPGAPLRYSCHSLVCPSRVGLGHTAHTPPPSTPAVPFHTRPSRSGCRSGIRGAEGLDQGPPLLCWPEAPLPAAPSLRASRRIASQSSPTSRSRRRARSLLLLVRQIWHFARMALAHRLSGRVRASLARALRQGANPHRLPPPPASLAVRGRCHLESAQICGPHAPSSGAKRNRLRTPP